MFCGQLPTMCGNLSYWEEAWLPELWSELTVLRLQQELFSLLALGQAGLNQCQLLTSAGTLGAILVTGKLGCLLKSPQREQGKKGMLKDLFSPKNLSLKNLDIR